MILNFHYYIVQFSYTTGACKKDTHFFLHCVDSRLERRTDFYSRFHIGPFVRGSRVHVGTMLRRSLINDLRLTSIIAIEIEGAQHEFSRLHGVYNNLLDLLFQFRKRSLCSSFLRLGEAMVVPFLFFGPGTFYAKDILWPTGVRCKNPNILLTTISAGKRIRGQLLIQKNNLLDLTLKRGKQFHSHRTPKINNHSSIITFKKTHVHPWLSIGFPNIPIKRVGFRVESIKSLRENQERLVLEIVTNGSVSPRKALKESTLCLINKFSIISERMSPIIVKKQIFRSKLPNFSQTFLKYFSYQNFSEQNFYP
jgi:DNA-directed RNA polymerase subunit alpha